MTTTTTPTYHDADLLEVKEAAAYLQVSLPTVQKWCRDGFLPAAKIGKEYRIRWGDLNAWLDRLAAEQRAGVPV